MDQGDNLPNLSSFNIDVGHLDTLDARDGLGLRLAVLVDYNQTNNQTLALCLNVNLTAGLAAIDRFLT